MHASTDRRKRRVTGEPQRPAEPMGTRAIRLRLRRLVDALHEEDGRKAASAANALAAAIGGPTVATVGKMSFTLYPVNGGGSFMEDVSGLDPDQLDGLLDSILLHYRYSW